MNLRQKEKLMFPFYLLNSPQFDADFTKFMEQIEEISCRPTYPWAQWFYARLIEEHQLHKKGNFAEFGVALGGMSLFLAKKFNNEVYAFDTYEGAPHSSGHEENLYYKKGDYGPKDQNLQEKVFQYAKDMQVEKLVHLIKEDFSSGKTAQRLDDISFVHLDCNLFQSTMGALEIVYDHLVEGGVLAFDEFFHHSAGVKKAAHQFFRKKGLTPRYHPLFPYSAVVIKGEKFQVHTPDIFGDFYSFDLLNDSCFIKNLESNIKKLKIFNEDASKAQMFKEIITSSKNSHDIYLYLWCLQDFWNSFYQNEDFFKQREIIKK